MRNATGLALVILVTCLLAAWPPSDAGACKAQTSMVHGLIGR